ncbi:hypothetical protein ceV_332 [Chrysochromulina ericina virus CeV-01B]|jgi:hypothetical protein|uniref:Uncharacterized protein n=1 Tax=Chrysochromulina ericina virus CeV-01B TaxID=3070830 RepID=A0A0N9QJA3_9VIRU|nr:hypothetical protein ceV_332 [Chrysochromulina ericina virus]ALH23238.1 hypothetical protein ceV_332 [Chrysochromulina ericina virus CeV-01B]|tara:strand:+ start:691 stop:1500 length:810 start_codon:yes stop_codon:yes gene_type:complete
MNLFGLEGIGFIISLAMTLLVSGAIMFYCLRRFKILENSIVEQGKVLQSFIIKYQNNNNELASSIALNSAIEQSKLQETSTNNKIEVSDDDSEYSDDSSSDEELDIDINESDKKDITLTTQDIDVNLLANMENVNLTGKDVKTLSITDVICVPLSDELVEQSIKEFSIEDNLHSNSDSDSDNESLKSEKIIEEVSLSKLEKLEKLEKVDNVDKVDKLSSDNTQKKTSNRSLSKMKVDDLRDLALKDTLETSENLKNMKKDQLLKLFNKN